MERSKKVTAAHGMKTRKSGRMTSAAFLLFRFAARRPGNVLIVPPSAPSRIFIVLLRALVDRLAFSPWEKTGVERAPPAGFGPRNGPDPAGPRASVLKFRGLATWESLLSPFVRSLSNFCRRIPRDLRSSRVFSDPERRSSDLPRPRSLRCRRGAARVARPRRFRASRCRANEIVDCRLVILTQIWLSGAQYRQNGGRFSESIPPGAMMLLVLATFLPLCLPIFCLALLQYIIF